MSRSNVALAAHYRTNLVLTLDRRDFRVLRPLTGYEAFRLLPDDTSRSPVKGSAPGGEPGPLLVLHDQHRPGLP